LDDLEAYLQQDKNGQTLGFVGDGSIKFSTQMARIVGKDHQEMTWFESNNQVPSGLSTNPSIREALYLGHAGLLHWGRNAWISADLFEGLNVPVVVAGTCLTNAFSYPGELESLGETLLRTTPTLVSLAPASPKSTAHNFQGVYDWHHNGQANNYVFERMMNSGSLRQHFSLLGDPFLPTAPDEEDDAQDVENDNEADLTGGGCQSNGNSPNGLAIGFLMMFGLALSRRKRRALD
jgi:hypothetical protein